MKDNKIKIRKRKPINNGKENEMGKVKKILTAESQSSQRKIIISKNDNF
jgi:hypothetical protein